MRTKLLIILFLIISTFAFCEEAETEKLVAMGIEDLTNKIPSPKGHMINFENVSVSEFVRFVSKIAGANFIYDEKLLDFNITLVSGKPTSSENVLKALLKILEQHNLSVKDHESYFLIQNTENLEEDGEIEDTKENSPYLVSNPSNPPQKKSKKQPSLETSFDDLEKSGFFVYKLQYHQGGEIRQAIKEVAVDPGNKSSPSLQCAIHSIQWIKATNSLLYSGNDEAIEELSQLIKSLDTPLKQVFIEVLVIETDVRNSLDFGLQWTGSGKFLDRVGFGVGNFPPGPGKAPLASTIQGIGASAGPSGASDFNIGKGFDLGVIGDIIWHKGASFLSLGSLLSAMQADGDCTIILNQKLITQDNKSSSIFVGDNIPFTGSVVQTVGASQQTTSNIEYRDIGVSLNITPLLGDGDIVTLDISEEISEATQNPLMTSSNQTNGIQTTKTNMLTRAHVPDQHFLVLSGMIRNTKKKTKTGLPCLGGLPLIGAAFSKNQIDNEKRNVIVFVRPQIINSIEQYAQITAHQEELYKSQSGDTKNFEKGLLLAKPINEKGEEDGDSGNTKEP